LLEPLRYIRINASGRHRLKGEHVFVYKLDINCREPKFKMTPLMIACLKGAKEIVEYLIDNGAILSLKDIRGFLISLYKIRKIIDQSNKF